MKTHELNHTSKTRNLDPKCLNVAETLLHSFRLNYSLMNTITRGTAAAANALYLQYSTIQMHSVSLLPTANLFDVSTTSTSTRIFCSLHETYVDIIFQRMRYRR